MASGFARSATDNEKQSKLVVSHTPDGGSASSFSMGITTGGVLAIGSGSDHSTAANQIMKLSDKSASGSKPTIEMVGNVVVRGNLIVVGQTTAMTIASETVAIGDNMIQLNANTSVANGYTPEVDFGFYGQTTIGGTANFTGVAYSKSANAVTTFRTITTGIIAMIIYCIIFISRDFVSSSKLNICERNPSVLFMFFSMTSSALSI